jgi:hypothetical protein
MMTKGGSTPFSGHAEINEGKSAPRTIVNQASDNGSIQEENR